MEAPDATLMEGQRSTGCKWLELCTRLARGGGEKGSDNTGWGAVSKLYRSYTFPL